MIYVWAFTSGIDYARSVDKHLIVMNSQGYSKGVPFPGEEMEKNKGDLWKIPMDSFGFPSGCVTPHQIDLLSIQAGGSNGWNIKSIVTTGILSNGNDCFLTANFDVYKWIDTDKMDQWWFPLSKVPE